MTESNSRRQSPNYLSYALKFFGGLFGLVLIGIAVLFAVVLTTYDSYVERFVSPDDMAVNRPSAGAKIVDRNGHLLYQMVDDRDGLRKPVALGDVSYNFLAATIATEDANFFENPGVNPRGLARAAWENFNPFSDILQGSGGSSITQQLVKNVYIPVEARSTRSIDRKIREIIYSLELTKRYDKSQILEWYVNQISYGGIYTGIEAASQGYFHKPARDLTLAEAALLAGVPQSPSAFDPLHQPETAAVRRNEVLDMMLKRESIQIGADIFFTPDPAEIEAARSAPIEVHAPTFSLEAPHFVLSYIAPQLETLVGKEALLHDGLIVTTTLDIELQHKAEGIVNGVVSRYENSTNSRNGAAVVFQANSGEILAMVGSRDYYRNDIEGQVNNLLGPRSPGSSFKPFVYLTAFMRLGWTPGTSIEDSPITYREQSGATFQPQNPVKNTYAGNVTVRRALGNSLNIPAFKTALQLGPDPIVAQAKSMGFTSLNNQYGPSIAIGGVDLRGLDLAFGYSALANMGVLKGQASFAPEKPDESEIRPVAILKITNSSGEVLYDVEGARAERRVAPAEHAFMITDVLSDPQAVCQTFGCGGLNVPGYRAAVKTGTSQPFDPNGIYKDKYADTWSFGYTADYVVGVWAGNSDRTPVSNIFSTTIAFPIMRDVMLAAYNGQGQTPFQTPTNVRRANVCAQVARFPSVVTAPGARGPQPVPTSQSCGTDLAVGR